MSNLDEKWVAANRHIDELRRQRDAYKAALHKIAYEPFGDAKATYAEVLQAITEFAREADKGNQP
jgi:hypothetical protein